MEEDEMMRRAYELLRGKIEAEQMGPFCLDSFEQHQWAESRRSRLAGLVVAFADYLDRVPKWRGKVGKN